MGNGLVCDIQRFCLHDGPGIRTVVFLKGCPLRCEWCCNPESQTSQQQLFYIKPKCLGCCRCVEECPSRCIRATADGKIEIDRGRCTGCLRCVEYCAGAALKAIGSTWSAEALLAEIAADKAFYDESGGGVTISGGEVLAQADFAHEILSLSKEIGINTAIETAGHGKSDSLIRLSETADFILFDLKHVNSAKHKRATGVSNDLILKNLEAILAVRRDALYIRIPLIPGFNLDDRSLDEIEAVLSRLEIAKIELLPYHRLGEVKSEFLGIRDQSAHFGAMTDGELARIRDRFLSAGFQIACGDDVARASAGQLG